MQKILGKVCMTLLAANYSFNLLSYDFSTADSLFQRRQDGFRASTIAKSEYEKSLSSSLSQEEKIYAISQMSRLDIYRGAMLDNIDKSTRKKVLESCVNNLSKIENTKSQEYHYFYIACVGFRGKLSSTLGRIKWALKMKSAQGDALNATKVNNEYIGGFEGGGILRVMSAVRGNRKAKPLGLYDPSEALQFAERALQTSRQMNKPFPSPMSGEDYHENYYYIGQAKIALGLENNNKQNVLDGLTVLDNAVERLDDLEDMDELPQGREPETAYYKNLMKDLISKGRSCINKSNWQSCLSKKLDD